MFKKYLCLLGIGFLMTSNGGGFMLAKSMNFYDGNAYLLGEEQFPALGVTLTSSPNDSKHYIGVWFGVGPRLVDAFYNAHIQIGVLINSQGVAPGLGMHLEF